MTFNLAQVWQSISQRVALPGPLLERRGAGGRAYAPRPDLHGQVEAALVELHAAQDYFQCVSDPELVDHAIFQLEAAQRKYMYLLKQSQRERQGGEAREAHQG